MFNLKYTFKEKSCKKFKNERVQIGIKVNYTTYTMAISNMIELFITQIAQHYDLGKNELEEMWKVLNDQKCNHVVKKGTPEEYVCGKTIKADGKCYKHTTVEKKVKDMTKCCAYIIHKKDGTEVQCIRNIKENGFCGKHIPKNGKGKTVNITTVIKCCHIIKKKDGSEAQCERNVQNNGKYCTKHTKKTNIEVKKNKNAKTNVEVDKETNIEVEKNDTDGEKETNVEVEKNDTDDEKETNVEVEKNDTDDEKDANVEVEKYANLFSDDEEQKKCTHIIKKKNGDKIVCGRLNCKKH
jgi:hypothetical protein